MISLNETTGVFTDYRIGPVGEATPISHWLPCSDGIVRGVFVSDLQREMRLASERFFRESIKAPLYEVEPFKLKPL